MGELLNDEYELGRRLGGGAEGEVYEAFSVRTKRKVAVKILKRGGPELLDSILKLKGRDEGPCAAVLEAFAEGGRIVAVLEFLDGAPLRERLASDDLPPSRRRELASALVEAVRGLHRGGLAHGDLSPDNVFVSRAGKLKLIDPRISTPKSAGAVLGTANYAAPETLHFGGAASAGGDVFSTAALLYEIFEGQDPFGCRSPEEYLIKAGARSLAVRPFQKTPEAYRRLISAGLQQDPRVRPKTIEALLALMESPGRRARAVALACAVLLLVAAWGFFSRKAVATGSVAVLPFVDEDGDPETEYLSDGLTESIINELAQSPSLRVSPRCSVLRYKGGADPLRAAGELGARAVVTGRVRRRGDAVVVSVELLDAQERKQLWGERYDRKAAAALEVQRLISRRIAESLRTKVAADAARRPAKRGTDSPEAYQAYLKGRYYWNRRTSANIGKALAQFQQAVEADPAYALAYIGLADCYALMEQYAGSSSAETLPKARAAAVRALELDGTLAEAHASLGYIALMSWRFDEAEKEFKRSLQLDPSYAVAHSWYGAYLHVVGRYAEALAEGRRSQELDPLAPLYVNFPCNVHLITGDIQTAIGECRKVFELDDRFPRTHDLLGWAYLKLGRPQEGLAELRKAAEFSGRASQELAYLGYGYGRLGRRTEAIAVLKELEKRFAERRSPAMFPAAVHAGLGEKDQAFSWLEKDFQARSGILVYITFFPIYDTLRDDPRYADLLRRMGIR